MSEIERKWRLDDVPGRLLRNVTPQLLQQSYLIVAPDELRLRSDGERNWLTVKSDGKLTREEWEVELPDWAYRQLAISAPYSLEKRRYPVMVEGRVWEVDIYSGALADLITVEVEVASEAEAQTLGLPTCFGHSQEVTDDSRYKNKRLAVDGLPGTDE